MTLFASLKLTFLLLLPALVLSASTLAQNTDQGPRVALQPLAQQVRQMEEALSVLGQRLPAGDAQRIRAELGQPDAAAAVAELGGGLSQYRLAIVTINERSRG